MNDWNARAQALEERLQRRGILAKREEGASVPVSLVIRGKQDFIFIDAEETDNGWTLGFANSYQSFDCADSDALTEVVEAILAGVILGFAIEVGAEREVCGWCERSFVPSILADYRDDPMTVGGVLVVRAFDGEAEETPLIQV